MNRILLFVLLLSFGLNTSAQGPQPPHVPGEALIQLAEGSSIADLTKDLAVLNGTFTGLRAEKELSKLVRIWQLSFDATQVDEALLLQELRRHPDVDLAQFNHYVTQRETTPDDPDFGSQWHHVNSNDSDIDSDLAWDITTGGTTAFGDEIVVCVIEGGNLMHPDLEPNRWVNVNEIPDNGIDDDNNGYVDDYDGWNVNSNNDNGVFDGGHGTQVMGMIGAKGNNTLGVSGINWNVKIMSVAGESLGNEASVISAYNYALVQRQLYNTSGGAQGAFVVATNASWGIDNGDPNDIPLWCAFYDTMGESGILNCGATANNNVNIDVVGDIPTACPSDYMISVTATNASDQRTFSAYGAIHVDLGAPGELVWTTSGTNGYGSTSGTSFASPLTAGAIALLYSVPCPSLMAIVQADPQTGADLIRQALFDGVDPVAQLEGETVTGGRLNVFNSLNILLNNCSSNDCLIPFAVNATSDNGVDYTVSWGGIASMLSFNFRYREAGSDTWIESFDLIENSFDLIGLEWCTDYEFQVQSNCEEESSDWSQSFFITTDGCCLAPDAMAFMLTDVSENEATISWPFVLAAESYTLTLTPDGGSPQLFEGVTDTEFTFTELEPCASYTVQVESNCAGEEGSGLSGTFSFNTFGCGACTDFSFCETYGNASEEWVGRVAVNTIDNTTGSDDGYGDYTSISTDLEQGDTYTINLEPGFDGFEFNEHFSVWIDYNQDGSFTASEKIFDSGTASPDPVNGSFTVPTDAVLGSSRMRVSMKYIGFFGGDAPQPCEEMEWGEVEDYCINIVEQTINVVEEKNAALAVYPNPSAGNFTFQLRDAARYDVLIYDAQGRLAHRDFISGPTAVLNLSQLSEGMYSFSLLNNGSAAGQGRISIVK